MKKRQLFEQDKAAYDSHHGKSPQLPYCTPERNKRPRQAASDQNPHKNKAFGNFKTGNQSSVANKTA
jgi:hypothetical protein